MRIGIDVGGTHTDAVLMDGDSVLAATKQATTADVATGISNALDALPLKAFGGRVQIVTIGTTQFTNAVVERRQLTRVGAIRVVAPAGDGLKPRMGWPEDIAIATDGGSAVIAGGHLYDGRPLAPLDIQALDRALDQFQAAGVEHIAVAAAFSPINPETEQLVAAHVAARSPSLVVSCSHEFGGLGLVERENAAILNASLLPLADKVAAAFSDAVARRDLDCPVYISQNDGTLMSLDKVRRYPALTFSSGPTNSIRGAWQLTGLDNAIVIDIGGTTSDLGVLTDGFPRQSNMVVGVGGVRTNFRMPDVNAIGLGGGSIVSHDGGQVGPRSVGHELTHKAIAMGGEVLTATDITAAAGRLDFGDPQRLQALDTELVTRVEDRIRQTLNHAAEVMKPGQESLPVILVGGGAVLLAGEQLAGGDIIRPDHAGVANAIGASIAQVSGEAEHFLIAGGEPREAVVAKVLAEAEARAVAAGGNEASLRTLALEETSIPYMDEGNLRIRAKVVADLQLGQEARP